MVRKLKRLVVRIGQRGFKTMPEKLRFDIKTRVL